MNGIDLRRFDLNLLVVIDVLMSERSVSRAADRLGRTQSAVSHSLARLRQLLSDPLLQRGAKGMAPTPFALELAERARPLLLGLGRMLEPRTAFDPATSARVFRLAAPDFSVTLFTEVRNRLHGEAPGVALDWTRPHRASLLELLDGRVDAAIVPA